jgi:hypothetical protein
MSFTINPTNPKQKKALKRHEKRYTKYGAVIEKPGH